MSQIEDALTKEELIAVLEKGCPECNYLPPSDEPCFNNEPDRIEFKCPNCGAILRYWIVRKQ